MISLNQENVPVEESIELKSSLILDSSFIVDKIHICPGNQYHKRIFDRFIKYLTDNKIPFSYEMYHYNRRWVFNISGYLCMFNRGKKKVAYLEGWVPEFESYSYVYGHLISNTIEAESLKMLKDNIIAGIRAEFNLENCGNVGLYDENSVVRTGTHQGKRLYQLKADALLKFNNEVAKNIDFDLYLYVQENLNRIQGQYRMEQKESHTRFLSLKGNQGIITFKCSKKTFATRKMAMEAIVKNPRKTKDGDAERKRPIRAYECRNCSGWHLTSKTVEEYKENVQRFNQEDHGTGTEELAGVPVTVV